MDQYKMGINLELHHSTPAEASSATSDKRVTRQLPITLLSGFLGSGKTTLLENILKSPDHGLKIAIIVNDVNQLNIDATLIKNHRVSQTKEKLIQLQNGCICCNLRGDLLSELARLAQSDEVDYVVIESTGVSEPMQVAETFTAEFSNAMLDMKETDHQALGDDLKILAEIVELGGLQNLAKLDTCVTVVDAFNLLNDFDTADFLSDRFGREGVEPEDERTISDLMTDQIEFADVIIINKIETVDESMRARIRQIAQLLNPGAKVIETSYAQVDVKEIVNTGRFDFLKAASGAGWLKSLHESMVRVTPHGNVLTPKPETIEYGINTFVYQNRRPFHPRRLFALLHDKFIILQNGENQDEDGATDDDDANVIDDNATSGSAGSSDDGTEQDDDETCQEFEQPDPKTVLWNKRKTPFGSVFRSKGFFWLATRPMQMGEWSQAGSMLTIGSGGPWFAEVPREAWPDDADIINSIEQDFDGTWGDRRQEIVFIGEKMDVQGICNMLDGCLLTSQEWDQWETIMSKPHPSMREKTMMLDKLWEDGWEPWSSIMIEVEVDEDGAGDRVATSADAPGPTHRISVPGHAGHLHVHNGQQRP